METWQLIEERRLGTLWLLFMTTPKDSILLFVFRCANIRSTKPGSDDNC